MESELVSVLEFRLNAHTYAIPVATVREIDPLGDITPLPGSSPFVCGVMNLRGQVIPVIDLKVRLGETRTAPTRESCIVVVDSADGAMGLLVDAVRRVINIPSSDVLPTPENCHLLDRSLVAAIAKENGRMITLLNIANCLNSLGTFGPTAKEPSLEGQAVKLLG